MGAMQDFIKHLMSDPHIQALEQATQNTANNIGKAVGSVPLINSIPGVNNAPVTANDIAQKLAPSTPISNFTQGTVQNIPSDTAKNIHNQAQALQSGDPTAIMGMINPATGVVKNIAKQGAKTAVEKILAEQSAEALRRTKAGQGVESSGRPSAEIIADRNAGVPPIVNSTQTGLPPIKTRSSGVKYAYGNQAKTKTNPGGEQIPGGEAPPNQKPPTKPFPDVPDEPRVVTDRTGKHPVTGGNPVWLDFSDQAKKNNYYLQDQSEAQKVLDNHVAGDTPLEVQKNLPLQQQEESQRIQNIIASNPQATTKQKLINDNTVNMQKAGITPGNNVKADDATSNLLKELDSQLNAGKKNIVNTDMVDAPSLQKYIHFLDDRLQSTYKKIDNGTTLTPEENATLTMRRTASNQLKTMYPSAEKALDRQSAMMDARPYVARAASQEMKDQTKAAADAASKQKPPGFVKKHAEALITGGVATLTGLGIYGLKQIPWGSFAGAGSNQLTGNKPTGNIDSNPAMALDTSPFSHTDTNDVKKRTGLPYTSDEYQRDIQSPQYVPGSNFKNTVDTNWANTQEIANQNLPGDTRSFMGGTAQQALNAQEQLQHINLKGLSSVAQSLKTSQDFQSYTSNPNNPYAKELAVLNNANSQYVQAFHQVTGQMPDKGNIIAPGDTEEQMKEKLQVQNKYIKDTYKQYQPYWDAVNPTNQVTTDTKTYSQNTRGLQTGSTTGLPAIPQGFSL